MPEQGQLQVIEKFNSGLLLRDYSGRLTFELFDIPGESYDLKKTELAKTFGLKRWGFTIHGFDESFQSFRKGKHKISIEWDIWSGLTIIAKNATAEMLITEVVSHFEIQAERNRRNPHPLIEQQSIRNRMLQLTQELSEYAYKTSSTGLFEYIHMWRQQYLKAIDSSHDALPQPVYSDEEIQALKQMHHTCENLLSFIEKQQLSKRTLLTHDAVGQCITQASDVYYLMLKRGRFSECIVCF